MKSAREFDEQAEYCKKHGYAAGARKFGLSNSGMRARIVKVYPDFKVPPAGRKRKLTRDQDLHVLRMREDGIPHSVIADKFGFTVKAMRHYYCKIKKRYGLA